MVDDPLADLPSLPSRGITRITVQSDDRDETRRGRASRPGPRPGGVARSPPGRLADPHLKVSGADGVLVMLTPPGQPGQRADLDRLPLVQAMCDHGWPAGVDGGVTDENLDQLRDSGARYAVVGRALTPTSAAR